MKRIILDHDPNDDWAQVELYRWQHGNLPNDAELPLIESIALQNMANAIEEGCKSGDASKMPTPYNVCSVLRYIAKKFTQQQGEVCEKCDGTGELTILGIEGEATSIKCPFCNGKPRERK